VHANAIAGAIEFDLMKQSLADFVPSRLFIYYNERDLEHSVPLDNGAQIRDGIKSVNQLGVCPETQWPYVPTPPNPNTNVWPAGARPAQKPPPACYREALNHQVVSYQRVSRDRAQLKGCLAAGYPFVFGFTVYDSFEGEAVKRTGVLKHARLVGSRRGRPRGAGRGVRRRGAAVHRAQLMGCEVGTERLFHDSLHLSVDRQPRVRFLDHPHDGGMSRNNICTRGGCLPATAKPAGSIGAPFWDKTSH
jgi:hypothetical protein